MAASPTPPHPNTATESPRPTPPVFTAAPKPAMIPQPMSPAAAGLASAGTLTACPAATKVSSVKAPMPKAGDRGLPSGSVHRLSGVTAVEAVPGAAADAGTAGAAGGAPGDDNEVAGGHVVDVWADAFDYARCLVAQQEGEVVVDGALTVVEVGVTDHRRPALGPAPRRGRGRGTLMVVSLTGAPLDSATTP